MILREGVPERYEFRVSMKGQLYMKSVISILLFAVMVTDAFGEAKMPDEYQVDWVGDVRFGGSVHDVFYISGNNTRRQNAPGDAATLIIISNAQENVTYRIDVPNKVYEEVPYHPEIIDDSRIRFAYEKAKDKEVRVELIGAQTIDGQYCDIYRVESLGAYHYEDTYLSPHLSLCWGIRWRTR